MRQVSAMTDEELREIGVWQEWQSGTKPNEWPYYDKTGAPIPPTATYNATEKRGPRP